MDTENCAIWQQACGDTDRNYSNLCLEWDIILNGPGSCGPYPECMEVLKHWQWVSSRKRTDIWRFAEQMKEGDIVVLRLGTSTILGVGVIVGSYEWLESFGDVDGWDLQHARRVRWVWDGRRQPKYFNTYTLKQGDTTQLMTSDEVKNWIKSLNINDAELTRTIKEIPHVGKTITEQEIADYLYEEGVSSNSIEILMSEFNELRRIAKWYRGKSAPSESETITYLIIPLLRSLGWTPQKMAIEWNKVDIALFDQLPRKDENLCTVVEAKKKDNSCLTAKSQAQGYAQGKVKCKRLIVSDGLRYGIYIKTETEYKLYAYFNLTDLRNSYPIYKCFGIKEGLKAMTPDWSE